MVCWVVLALATSSLSPSHPAPQDTLHVPSDVSCATCEIRLEHVATLGAGGDPVALQDYPSVAVDSHGNIYVNPTVVPGQVAMFDRSGRHVRSLGRSGRGPGEFGPRTRLVIGPTDSIHVLDGARHTVLAPLIAGVASLRTIPVGANTAVELPDGTLLVNAIGSRDEHGYPLLHTLGPSSEVRRSFGPHILSSLEEPRAQIRILALASSVGIWVAALNTPTIERWNTDGDRDLVIARDADWFPPSPVTSERFWEQPPKPTIGSMMEWQGLLLVTVSVADANWKPTAINSRAGSLDMLPEPDRVFDTIIEAIDIVAGKVVSRLRVDQAVMLLTNGYAVTHRKDSDGNPTVDVWRVNVLRGPRREPARHSRRK